MDVGPQKVLVGEVVVVVAATSVGVGSTSLVNVAATVEDALHALRLRACLPSTATAKPRIERATARRLKGVDAIFKAGSCGSAG